MAIASDYANLNPRATPRCLVSAIPCIFLDRSFFYVRLTPSSPYPANSDFHVSFCGTRCKE